MGHFTFGIDLALIYSFTQRHFNLFNNVFDNNYTIFYVDLFRMS